MVNVKLRKLGRAELQPELLEVLATMHQQLAGVEE
jgi:hypothetical protein